MKKLFGSNMKKLMDRIETTNHSYFDSDENEEDDPILPVYDPITEGIGGGYADDSEDDSSDGDELNIRERMKRPFLQQTPSQSLIKIKKRRDRQKQRQKQEQLQ